MKQKHLKLKLKVPILFYSMIIKKILQVKTDNKVYFHSNNKIKLKNIL